MLPVLYRLPPFTSLSVLLRPNLQLLLTIYKSMCIVPPENLEEERSYASDTISSSACELAAWEGRTRDGTRTALSSGDGDCREHSPWDERRRGAARCAAQLRRCGAGEGGVS